MKNIDVYVDIKHSNYWWGVHRLTCLTDWEDVAVFRKWGTGYRILFWTCISSKKYLRNNVEDLRFDIQEEVFVKDIDTFLNAELIVYQTDPSPKGLVRKPNWIETWYPCEGIDKSIIDEIVKEICIKFHNIQTSKILYKDEVDCKSAVESYLEYQADMQKATNVTFSEDVICELIDSTGKSRDEVMVILNRSI